MVGESIRTCLPPPYDKHSRHYAINTPQDYADVMNQSLVVYKHKLSNLPEFDGPANGGPKPDQVILIWSLIISSFFFLHFFLE